ncbi:hypothetical protein [Micromonospora globispora]|uniref:hypothetical protein n=1 Tax=Micromonospora globispora TaxID=1450148 RepID=UPI001402F081|nr:hypothetical protein [Micromonospora globispora]
MQLIKAILTSARGGSDELLPSNPPSDTTHNPTVRAEISFSAHRLCVRVVSQPKPELPVDLGLVVRVGVAEHGDDVAERSDQDVDLGTAHPAWLR